MGMLDFAGSAVVHAVGGWSSLAAVLVLGARSSKYNEDGSINFLPPHNLHLAFLGAFILWFGWNGFNAGSSLSGMGHNIARIALNTNLAAAAGGIMATFYTMFRWGKAEAFGATYLIFTLLKKTVGIRVTLEEEINGLDVVEHDISAYASLDGISAES